MSIMDVKAVFASDIGWKAGEWRKSVVIDGITYSKSHMVASSGELVGWIYRDKRGVELMIYND